LSSSILIPLATPKRPVMFRCTNKARRHGVPHTEHGHMHPPSPTGPHTIKKAPGACATPRPPPTPHARVTNHVTTILPHPEPRRVSAAPSTGLSAFPPGCPLPRNRPGPTAFTVTKPPTPPPPSAHEGVWDAVPPHPCTPASLYALPKNGMAGRPSRHPNKTPRGHGCVADSTGGHGGAPMTFAKSGGANWPRVGFLVSFARRPEMGWWR
jgi:hypothetical protein